MRLLVTTPTRTVVRDEDVRHIRAEDDSGAFGILSGHAELVTALSISVVMWRDKQGVERFVAVRGGLLRVRRPDDVEIATREAVVGDELRQLESEVVTRFRLEEETATAERAGETKMQLAAIRQLYDFARAMRGRPAAPGRLRAVRETRISGP